MRHDCLHFVTEHIVKSKLWGYFEAVCADQGFVQEITVLLRPEQLRT